VGASPRKSLCSRGTAFTRLFVYDFDLLVDYLPGKPINRHVPPVALFSSTSNCEGLTSDGQVATGADCLVSELAASYP